MKNVIELIENLIKEHETANYCTNLEDLPDDLDWESYSMFSYDVGRYETLVNLLNDIKKMGE